MDLDKIKKLNDFQYLKEEKGNVFRIIYPIKKDLDKPFGKGNIHWGNFLGTSRPANLIGTLFILALLFFVIWGYYHDITACYEVINKLQPGSEYEVMTNPFNFTINGLGVNNGSEYSSGNLSLPSEDNVEIR